MTSPKNRGFQRPRPSKRALHLARTASARQAIGELQPGHEVFALTYGQFSLADAIVALLAQTGPATVDIMVWTVSPDDLLRLTAEHQRGALTQLRMIIDYTLPGRHVSHCEGLKLLLEASQIRFTRVHAKVVLIRNDQWSLTVRTSANLNINHRMEFVEVSDDPAMCAFMTGVFDELFDEIDEGARSGSLPLLGYTPTVEQASGIAMGRVGAVKPLTTGRKP